MTDGKRKLNFGRKIANYLLQSGTTRESIARRAGLRDPETVTKLEGGDGQCWSLQKVREVCCIGIAGFAPSTPTGTIVTKLREARHWSQNALATRAEVSPQAIARVEAGGGKVASLEAALVALGVTQADLAFTRAPDYRKTRLSEAITILKEEGVV